MTQSERRLYLIKALLGEDERYKDITVPRGSEEQKILLRALLNVRMPAPVSDEFLKVQNAYLSEEISKSGVTDYKALTPVDSGIYLWQGDITTLKCDAVVNAANNRMLGCFCPNHKCIDNAIHTFSGVQLRLKMQGVMQGGREQTGKAKITPAYNLPSGYIIHTVGPIVNGRLTKKDCELLRACYNSCLELADEKGLGSIAFCCISTGEFGFPNEEACQIAIDTVYEYRNKTGSKIEVIFNVFKDKDYEIYRKHFAKRK